MDKNVHVMALGQKVLDNEVMMGMILTQMEQIRKKMTKPSGIPVQSERVDIGPLWYNDLEKCKEGIEAIKEKIAHDKQDTHKIQTLVSALEGIEGRMQKIDVKIDHMEAKEVESDLLGLVKSNQSKELSTTTASMDLAEETFKERLLAKEQEIIKNIFNQVETVLKAQQQLMEGSRDKDRKDMADLVRKEISTLHQELMNQNASHDIAMMDNEVDPLTSEIHELKTIVQGLESFVHKQQDAIEQFSEKLDSSNYLPHLCELAHTDYFVLPEDNLERRVSVVESSIFSEEAEAQREARDAEKFSKFQKEMLKLIESMVEERTSANAAELSAQQSKLMQIEAPELDLEKEFNSRFSAFKKAINDAVERQVVITIERQAIQEKPSDVSEDLRLQIMELKTRDEENRRKISDQAEAIEKIASGLSCPDSRTETPQGSHEAMGRVQESPHEENADEFGDSTNNIQSGSSHISMVQTPEHPGHREEETSIPNSSNNTPFFRSTTFVDRTSQFPSQESTPVHNPENDQSTSQSTPHIHVNGQSATARRTGCSPATPVLRKRKWRKSNETPKKPKCPSLRQERKSMTPQVKEADEQTANQVQKHFRLMAGVGRSKADFPKSPTHSDLKNLPKLTVDYETAPLGEAVPNLIRQDQLQPTWKLQEMEHEASGMLQYCRRRLQQYGLPYVGLSIAKGDIKAEDWNRRVLAFCTDTFNRAYGCQEYHVVDHNPQRIMKLMQTHIEYRLKFMRRYSNNEDVLQRDQKQDRQQQRRLRVRCGPLDLP
ncbi:hypothetical protein DFH28DRAFT_1085239 [Melampsora americana]|nr:hypothetical protein DFH28DRAFT_1085239 [Melampsora americana]